MKWQIKDYHQVLQPFAYTPSLPYVTVLPSPFFTRLSARVFFRVGEIYFGTSNVKSLPISSTPLSNTFAIICRSLAFETGGLPASEPIGLQATLISKDSRL